MLEHIKKETLKFLQSDTSEVLVIKGRWGTGKTFTWHKWLIEAKKENLIHEKQYVYISLFGCNSLDDLKIQIFSGLVPTRYIGEKITDNFLKKAQNIFLAKEKPLSSFDWEKVVSKITNIKTYQTIFIETYFLIIGLSGKILRFVKDVPAIKNVSIDIDDLGWMAIRDSLVCIDDIERKGDNLNLKDVYGLISVLKEQKNCKVALILNEEYLTGDNETIYKENREKVVDVELHFDPETDDLIQLIFDPKNEHYDKITTCIKSLAEKNVRTIQKIKRYVDIISPHLNGLPDRYKNSIISSIVLFTVLYFSNPEEWPTLDEVLEADTEKFALVHWVDDEEKARIHKVDLAWIQNLSILKTNYEWAGADETDQVLGRFVKQGYLNTDELKAVLEKTAQDANRAEAKEEVHKLHHRVGEALHESMDDNFDDLVKVMHESIQKSTELYPSVAHLNQYISILRALEADDEANALIDYYIKLANKKNSKYFYLSNSDRVFAGPLDKVLEEKIQAASKKMRESEIKKMLKEINRQEKIQEVVNKSYERRFSDQDIETLSKFTAADFITFFKQAKMDKNERDFIKLCLYEHVHYQHLKDEFEMLKAIMTEVVKKLAAENRMNRFRLKAYIEDIERLEANESDEV